MERRTFLWQSALAFGGLGLAPGHLRYGLSGHWQALRDGVGCYTDRGGTIGCLVEAESVAVVDTQFPDTAAAFLTDLQQRRALQPAELLLVNTHHHGDHTGGNPVFKDWLKTHVAHQNARDHQERVAREKDVLAEVLLPTTTFTKDWQLALGNETVALRHFGPGHTNGDAVVHFERANVAHLGDLLFNRRFPYIDAGAGGHFGHWAAALRRIHKYYDRDTIFIFGHAADSYPVFGTQADVAAMENYLLRLLDYVGKAQKRGLTLAQLQEQTTTIPRAEEWCYGERLRDVNLAVAWAELEKK